MRKPLNMMLGVCAIYGAMLISTSVQAQDKTEAISYGANPAAGHYLSVDDARIYYETYGSGGTPLVLLHGGLYRNEQKPPRDCDCYARSWEIGVGEESIFLCVVCK